MTMDLRPIRIVRSAVRASVLAAVVIASGCGSGNVGVEPAIGSVNPIADSKLQFAVGVATINDVAHSKVVETLNTVETLRQPDGLSAVLYSIPYITGPPGFIGQPDPILGNPTTIISGSGPKIPCNKTTLQCTGGAFGYGFAPDNTVPGQQAVSFAEYFQPVAVGNLAPQLRHCHPVATRRNPPGNIERQQNQSQQPERAHSRTPAHPKLTRIFIRLARKIDINTHEQVPSPET